MGKKRAYNSYSLIYDETIVNSVDISTQWIGQFSVEEILNSVDIQKKGLKEIKKTTTKKAVDVLYSGDKETTTLANLMQEKWPHPNPPNESVLKRMVDKFSISVCTDAMDGTPTDMVNAKWDSIYAYMRKVCIGLSPKPPFIGEPEEDKAVNWLKQAVQDYRNIDPVSGLSPRANRASFLINSMRPYRKWYDEIDNLGAIVGMELDEYERLLEGELS